MTSTYEKAGFRLPLYIVGAMESLLSWDEKNSCLSEEIFFPVQANDLRRPSGNSCPQDARKGIWDVFSGLTR